MKTTRLISLLALALTLSCAAQPQGCSNMSVFSTSDTWCEWRVSQFGGGVPSIPSPDSTQITTDGAGSQGVYAGCFDDTTAEHIGDTRIIPVNIALSSSIKAYIGWFQNAAGTGNVKWCQEFGNGYPGDDINSTASTEVCEVVAASGTNGELQITEFDAVPITLTSRRFMSLFRLGRDAGDAADTFTGDVCLAGLTVYYKCDRSSLGALP